jgi:hypothetical protein
MLGGLAFMVDRNMACGIVKDELMLRVGAEGAELRGWVEQAAAFARGLPPKQPK